MVKRKPTSQDPDDPPGLDSELLSLRKKMPRRIRDSITTYPLHLTDRGKITLDDIERASSDDE